MMIEAVHKSYRALVLSLTVVSGVEILDRFEGQKSWYVPTF